MKKFLSFFLCLPAFCAVAQKPIQIHQSNWQQRVNYSIDVTLDDEHHMLNANEKMTYFNNSPIELTELYMHLWPNAYKNNETAFAKQQVENGNTLFYYAKEEDRGYIDMLDFKVDGQPVKWELTSNIDICRITLNTPLKPGSSIEITTPFRVKMPAVFSRMGHENQLYCVTQWYPKPAVFDVNGWNPIPYLDQGEFYSEYGNFEVSITVPKDYVVTATGVLAEKEEKDWWLTRLREKTSHPSSSPTKTLHFSQDSVHDFAWFTSKDFLTAKSQVTLGNGHTVETWMFAAGKDHEKRIKAAGYINEAVKFYSDKVGSYPFSHATVVVTPLKAGGGMEYPTITNVGDMGRQVIVHEVGHNWFYGILGSNEREYPWMDESINNYYETRSAAPEKIAGHTPLAKGLLASKGDIEVSTLLGTPFRMIELTYLLQARNNTDQKAFLPSVEFTDGNYGGIIYGKASLAFHHLQRYLGDSLFDAMMHSYYEKWKFKHPLPGDFIDHAKAFTGKDLNWFFDGLMNTTEKTGYKVTSLQKKDGQYEVKVKNNSNVATPFSISLLNDNKDVSTVWKEGFTGKQKIVLPQANATHVRIDAYEETVDVNRKNNTARTSGLLKTWKPLKITFAGDLEDPNKNQLFIAPVVGMNFYNKTMLGLAFYNSLLPKRSVEYVFTPMYAFGTKDLAGYGSIEKHFYTRGLFRKITVGVSGARFGSEMYEKSFVGPSTYEKIDPKLIFYFKPKYPRTSPDKRLELDVVLVNEQQRTRELLKGFDKAYQYANAKYVIESHRKLNPYSMKVHYQFGQAESQFQKISAEATYFVNYKEKNKGLKARVFAGTFIQKPTVTMDDRVFWRVGDNTGYFDYMYEQSQFGRAETFNGDNLFSRQLMPGGLQFRANAPLGSTDSWVAGLNLTTHIPGILPLRIFADLAFSDAYAYSPQEAKTTYTTEAYYTAGFSLVLFNEILEINFPVWGSKNLSDYWTDRTNSYGERMSFTLNLNKLNPIKYVRNVSL